MTEPRPTPFRERLPDTRPCITHKFSVGGQEGYMRVGLYPDGRPAELFINLQREGSTVGGLMNIIGILTSVALQYGVPLDDLIRKLSGQRFEPSGYTGNPEIPMADSPVDYIFRWMEIFTKEKEPSK